MLYHSRLHMVLHNNALAVNLKIMENASRENEPNQKDFEKQYVNVSTTVNMKPSHEM